MKHTLNVRTLYNLLLYPYLNYGILCWRNVCKNLVSLQKKTLRLISTQERLGSINSCGKDNNMLKFEYLFNVNLGNFMYYMETNEAPRVRPPKYVVTIHGGPPNSIVDSACSAAMPTLLSFLFIGLKLCNTLSYHLINSSNQDLFVQQ